MQWHCLDFLLSKNFDSDCVLVNVPSILVVRQSQELGSEQISRMALAAVLKLQPELTPKRLILQIEL